MKETKLVLMSCCAPCSCGAIAELRDACRGAYLRPVAPQGATKLPRFRCDGAQNPPDKIGDFVGARECAPTISEFCVLFYNPNIFPESEYQKRLAEQIKYCESLG
jgi:predicted adenine nucleotide alpha hydrolase (AANH) superfamily ATPase